MIVFVSFTNDSEGEDGSKEEEKGGQGLSCISFEEGAACSDKTDGVDTLNGDGNQQVGGEAHLQNPEDDVLQAVGKARSDTDHKADFGGVSRSDFREGSIAQECLLEESAEGAAGKEVGPCGADGLSGDTDAAGQRQTVDGAEDDTEEDEQGADGSAEAGEDGKGENEGRGLAFKVAAGGIDPAEENFFFR